MATFVTPKGESQILPQELVNKIIGHLDAHRLTVISCSQVCRAFSVDSQGILFATIRIQHELSPSGGRQVARFAHLLENSPHLGLYVKHVTLCMYPPSRFNPYNSVRGSGSTGDEHLVRILTFLKRLRSLVISPRRAFIWSRSLGRKNLESIFQTSLCSASLVSIELNNLINFDPTIISHFQSLQCLKLCDVNFMFSTPGFTPSSPQSGPLPPVRLEDLKFFLSMVNLTDPIANLADSTANFAKFLDNCIFNTYPIIDVSGLRSLSIQEPMVYLLEHTSKLFRRCSSRLEFLDIKFMGRVLDSPYSGLSLLTSVWLPLAVDTVIDIEPLNLLVLSNLQILEFRHTDYYIVGDRSARILQTLPSSNKLRILTFHCDSDILYWDSNFHNATWNPLDLALISMELTCLQSVTFIIHETATGRIMHLLDRLYGVLPKTRSLGVTVDFIQL